MFKANGHSVPVTAYPSIIMSFVHRVAVYGYGYGYGVLPRVKPAGPHFEVNTWPTQVMTPLDPPPVIHAAVLLDPRKVVTVDGLIVVSQSRRTPQASNPGPAHMASLPLFPFRMDGLARYPCVHAT